METLKKIRKVTDVILTVAIVIYFLFMFGFTNANVITRYGFNKPIVISNEIARYSYVAIIFLGAIFTMRSDKHLSLDFFVARMPRTLSFCVTTFGRILTLIFLGIVTVSPYHHSEDLELSYMFLPEFWGRGYAAESLQLALDRCRDEWNIHTLISETPSKNLRSCHLLERLGYTLDRQEDRFDETQSIYIKRM